MTGLPHHRRIFATDDSRIGWVVTLLAIVLLAAASNLGSLVLGINIGRDQERAAHQARERKAALDSVKPAYGQRMFACTKEERREYLEACRQRLRSNLTGGS